MRWVHTPGVGYCAPLGAGRFAYAERSPATRLWKLRIGRPGRTQPIAVRGTLAEVKALAAERRIA